MWILVNVHTQQPCMSLLPQLVFKKGGIGGTAPHPQCFALEVKMMGLRSHETPATLHIESPVLSDVIFVTAIKLQTLWVLSTKSFETIWIPLDISSITPLIFTTHTSFPRVKQSIMKSPSSKSRKSISWKNRIPCPPKQNQRKRAREFLPGSPMASGRISPAFAAICVGSQKIMGRWGEGASQ